MAQLQIVKSAIGDAVTEDLFGGNFLAFRDRIGEGTYDEVASKLNLQTARFPGGSVTEEFFDINHPNQTEIVSHLTGEVLQRLSLTEFISWSNETGITPTIVIPTRHALSSHEYGQRVVTAEAINDLKIFIADLLGGRYGEITNTTLEIGNEYWGSGQMTASEYGSVASAFSLAIQQEIDEFVANNSLPQDWVEPKIAVQIGQAGEASPGSEHGSSDVQNDVVIAEFNTDEAAAVDAVVGHYYARNGFEAINTNEWVFRRLDAWSNDGKFGDLEHHITEWNVSARQATEYGLESASMIAHIFAEFIERGVDSAVVWPVQQNTVTSLSWNEGTTDLTFAGETFRIFGENLIGTSLNWKSIKSDFGGFLYESETHEFLILASHSEQSIEYQYSLGDLSENYAEALLTRLYSDGATNDHNLTPSMNTQKLLFSEQQTISVELQPFELVIYQFGKEGSGFQWNGQHSSSTTPGSTFDDIVTGTEKTDFLHGMSGDDELHGLGGDDTIWGGDGDDLIYGEDGSDEVYAGAGDDVVYGGNGRDTVYLGSGNDRFEDNWQAGSWGLDIIRGGDGNDSIFARYGDDKVFGDAGHDHLEGGEGSDEIHGGIGDDRLEGGRGKDTLNGDEGDDLLLGGDGYDKLFGGDGKDHLFGGKGNDVLKGQGGDDVLHGEAGADLLLGGDGDDVLYGNWGKDELFGYGGNDILKGGDLDDQLSGGLGNDRLHGGAGDDVLNGGAGADVFIFNDDIGSDTIIDFDYHEEGDRISVAEVSSVKTFSDLFANTSETENGILIDFGAQIEVLGLTLATMTDEFFIF